MSNHLISLMVFLPFVGALTQGFLPARAEARAAAAGRWIALVTSILSSLIGIGLILSMQAATPEMQLTESFAWIGSYAISYEMGLDGLNALMVLLVSVLFPVLIAAEWNQKLASRGMYGLFLLLQTSLLGAICAQDLFLQFFFWGFSAFPFYFLIGIWGGENREAAAFRSVVAAVIGNALLFTALLLVYYSIDPHTFALKELTGGKFVGKTFEIFGQEVSVPLIAFSLIGLGLALRTPIWPLHGWFTQVAEEAPASVLVALAAGTVPVGSYIFVRLGYSVFPETVKSAAQLMIIVGTVNLLVGAICAVAQRGLRRLLAFVTVSQLGLILIGIGSLNGAGIVGAIYQQLVFGLGLAGLGLLIGLIIERAGHASFLRDDGTRPFGGLAVQAPAIAITAGVVMASLIGFPGFGGFVSQSLVVLGSYSVHSVNVLLAAIGFLLAAYYFFTMYRLVFLGKQGSDAEKFQDLTWRERAYLLPVVAALLAFGLYPKPLLEVIRPTALTLLSMVK